MKRSPLRKQSKKTRVINTANAPSRQGYVMGRKCVIEQMKGSINGTNFWATDCHEIYGGRWRQRTKLDKRFWLPVNRLNHDELQNMPKAKQWALKALYDPRNFDIKALSELPGSVVDPADVLLEIVKLRTW